MPIRERRKTPGAPRPSVLERLGFRKKDPAAVQDDVLTDQTPAESASTSAQAKAPASSSSAASEGKAPTSASSSGSAAKAGTAAPAGAAPSGSAPSGADQNTAGQKGAGAFGAGKVGADPTGAGRTSAAQAGAGQTGSSSLTAASSGAAGTRARTGEQPRSGTQPLGRNAQTGGQTPGPSTATIPVVAAGAAAAAGTAAAKPKGKQPATPVAPAKAGGARRTRKARLRLSRLDPWSVMKTAFLFSIAAGIMLVVAVYVVWTTIGSSGLFDSLNEIVASVVSTPGDTTPFRVEDYVNTQKVMGVTAILAVFDVVIFTALATLGSFLYNLAATMLGGLEVTLAED